MGHRESYAGLCVGGPLAGKSVAYQHQRMEVDVRPPLPVLNAGEAIPADLTTTRITYNWHHTGAQGLWIPQGETLHDAINAMALAYMEKCNGRG